MIGADTALSAYISHHRTLDQVTEDFARLKYIKRLVNRLKKNKPVNERLLLNHFIIWFNVFEKKAAVSMLFNCTAPEDWAYIIPFVSYIGFLPAVIPGTDILSEDIEVNKDILNRLSRL